MNLIRNATGLDGVTGWLSSGGVPFIDATDTGAPNRIVIGGTGGDLYQTVAIPAAGPHFFAAFHRAGQSLRAQFYGSAGDIGGVVTVPLRRSPPPPLRRGIASTFARSAGVIQAPVGAEGVIYYVAGPGQPVLFRPQISPGVAECWRPGSHLNPDLVIPAFPAIEPQRDGFELEPIPLRKGFAGDAGIPITRRVASSSRRFATCEFALDAIARDELDPFWRANHAEFWFVRPDNGALCIAEWAEDGDPRDSGAGASRRTTVRVLLRDS